MEAVALTVSVWTSAIPLRASTSFYSKDNEKEKVRGAIEQQVQCTLVCTCLGNWIIPWSNSDPYRSSKPRQETVASWQSWNRNKKLFVTRLYVQSLDVISEIDVIFQHEIWKHLAGKLKTKDLYCLPFTLPHITLSFHILIYFCIIDLFFQFYQHVFSTISDLFNY